MQAFWAAADRKGRTPLAYRLRGSDVPVSLRGAGFDMAAVANELAHFINTGRLPRDKVARTFIKSPPA